MKKDVNLTVDSLKIEGQLHLPEDANAPYPAVILCHGIPSGIVDPADGGYPLLAKTISDEGFAVFTFSFRGSGNSGGNFDIGGWARYLEAAIDYLWDLDQIGESQLSLVGFSAGASVSIYVAAQDKRISAVVSCAAPADFSAVYGSGKALMSLNYFRKIGIIRDPGFPASFEEWLNNFRKVNAVHSVADIAPRPLLIIHGGKDNVVPLDHARKLFEKASEPKQLVILEGADHRLRRNPQAVKTIIHWLKGNLS